MANNKKITVINIKTGEEFTFKSRVEMSKYVKMDRMTITRQLINQNKTLAGVWRLKHHIPRSNVKHLEFLQKQNRIRQCQGCKVMLAVTVQICPICGKKQF